MERKVSLELGGQTLTISTGKWAKLAGGSAVVQLGGTVVLVAAATGPAIGDRLPQHSSDRSWP